VHLFFLSSPRAAIEMAAHFFFTTVERSQNNKNSSQIVELFEQFNLLKNIKLTN